MQAAQHGPVTATISWQQKQDSDSMHAYSGKILNKYRAARACAEKS